MIELSQLQQPITNGRLFGKNHGRLLPSLEETINRKPRDDPAAMSELLQASSLLLMMSKTPVVHAQDNNFGGYAENTLIKTEDPVKTKKPKSKVVAKSKTNSIVSKPLVLSKAKQQGSNSVQKPAAIKTNTIMSSGHAMSGMNFVTTPKSKIITKNATGGIRRGKDSVYKNLAVRTDELGDEQVRSRTNISPRLMKHTTRRPLQKTISLEELKVHFNKPIVEVAKEFGVCITLMKKICRKNGIKRWPHRLIRSLDKRISSAEAAVHSATGAERQKCIDILQVLKRKLAAVFENPNIKMKETDLEAAALEREALDYESRILIPVPPTPDMYSVPRTPEAEDESTARPSQPYMSPAPEDLVKTPSMTVSRV